MQLTFSEAIERLKEIDIRLVLNHLGIKYKSNYGRVIFSIRDERTPSCSAVVRGGIWLWRDFGDDKLRGTNIDLYSIVKGLSFTEAVLEMSDVFLSSDIVNDIQKEDNKEDYESKVKIISVMSKFLDKQIEYLKNRKAYPPPKQIKPLVYEINNKRRYGIGMETLNGGWVIRQTLDINKNGGARYLFVGQADITYWGNIGSKLVIVEGMFDGISALKLSKQKDIQVLILNSVINYEKAISFIKEKKQRFNQVLLALDTDEAGMNTAKTMYNELKDIIDVRILNYDSKDLNELLINNNNVYLEDIENQSEANNSYSP